MKSIYNRKTIWFRHNIDLEGNKLKKRIKAGIAIILVLAIGTGGFFTYRYVKNRNSISVMNVSNELTEIVERTSFVSTITASGNVVLADEIEVYAEGDENWVRTIYVEEGDTVNVGDLLIEYDTDDREEELENQIRDTKREIENAKLSLESMTAATSDTELAKLKSEITSSEKSLQEAQTTYESYTTKLAQQQNTIDNAQQDVDDAEKDVSDIQALMAVGGATQSEYNSAVTTLERAKRTLSEAQDEYNNILTEQANAKMSITIAENNLINAQNEYNDALTPLSTEQEKIQYQQQLLTLQGLEDNLADYEKDLSELVYSTSSTVNGKVTEVCIDEGTYTEENTVVLKVADFSKLTVDSSIEEYDAPLVEVGQKVVMTSDGIEGVEYTGTVTKVSDSAEDTSTNIGTETAVPIEISVDNPDGILKPGYTLDLEITVVDKQDVLAVSSSAVMTDAKEGVQYVYIVEGGVISRREVTTGETNDTQIEIVSGLNEGDEIISNPDESITEGMTLDEYREQMSNNTSTGSTSSDSGSADMGNGGMGNDQNRGSNQGVPSGGPGGGGFGGGGPMG